MTRIKVWRNTQCNGKNSITIDTAIIEGHQPARKNSAVRSILIYGRHRVFMPISSPHIAELPERLYRK